MFPLDDEDGFDQRFGRVLSVGWNGLDDGSCLAGKCPRGLLSYGELPPNAPYTGNCPAIHAEESRKREALRTYRDTEIATIRAAEVTLQRYFDEAFLDQVDRVFRGRGLVQVAA